jgi:long-subunit acyl-CoA synthetase (AMP-forming)
MRNRPEFHVVDLAATFLRATPVSIYNSSSPEELQYLVAHTRKEGMRVLERHLSDVLCRHMRQDFHRHLEHPRRYGQRELLPS